MVSLPSRECGLKYQCIIRCVSDCGSLPSRERGLKYRYRRLNIKHGCVAPFAGAWIEIISSVMISTSVKVAPFVGAWIEIAILKSLISEFKVAPFVGHGLKYAYGLKEQEEVPRRSLHGSVD